MATLFGRDKSVISRYLGSVLKNNELDNDSVVAKNATTESDGKIYQVNYYNLDAILSVGYRVSSKQGTQFRIWEQLTETNKKKRPPQVQAHCNSPSYSYKRAFLPTQ